MTTNYKVVNMLTRRFPLRTVLLGLVALIMLAILAQALRQGLFEMHNDYILTAPHVNGIRSGVGVEFAGFEIGRVQGVSLNTDGQVEISIRVSRQYEELVRADSQFALEQPFFGVPKIVVEPTAKRESPLPSGSVRTLRITKQMEQLMENSMAVAEQMRVLLSTDSALNKTLGNIQELTARANNSGLLRVTLGDASAGEAVLTILRQSVKVTQELQKTLTDVQGLMHDARAVATTATKTLRNVNETVVQARKKTLGNGGTLALLNTMIVETTEMLKSVRNNLKELQKTLGNATLASGEVVNAAKGLNDLRANVDSISRNINSMLLDLKRFRVFSKENEMRLP